MRAIRIIRGSPVVLPPVAELEREEQLRSVTQHHAEALDTPLPKVEKQEQEKDASFSDHHESEEDPTTEILTAAVGEGLQVAHDPMAVHAEMDLSRIFELLED